MSKKSFSEIILLMLFFYATSINVSGQIKIYVDSAANGLNNGSTWKDAYKSLMPALTQANSRPDIVFIYIAKGTYYPGKNNGDTTACRDSSFRILRTKIKLEGGYPSGGGNQNYKKYRVVLSGDIGKKKDTSDNCYHILTITGASSMIDDSASIIKGVVFKNGNANAGYTSYSVVNGIKVYNYQGSAVYYAMVTFPFSQHDGYDISYCEFSENYALPDAGAGSGGAVFCYGYNAQLIRLFFSHCLFNYNKSHNGGVLACYQYNAIILFVNFSDCILKNNTARYGGAIYQTGDLFGGINVTMDRCVLEKNSSTYEGGAVYTSPSNEFSSAWFTATNTNFIKNSSSYGGAVSASPGATVSNYINCNFLGNTAHAGGAVTYGGGFENCLFYRNSCTGTYSVGGALYNPYVVKNCVFAENMSSGYGAAISNGADHIKMDFQITNTTFINNFSAADSLNAIYISGYWGGVTATINNSIIWGTKKRNYKDSTILRALNDESGISSCKFILNNTLLQGKAPAATTFNDNSLALLNKQPLFKDYTNLAGPDGIWGTTDDGLELRPNSPAINAGNNSFASDIKKDITGIKRIQCDTVDLGAYERRCPGFAPAAFNDINNILPSVSSLLIYPNPSVNGIFKIDLSAVRNNISISVTDNNGRKVYAVQNSSAQYLELDLGNQPAGIYYLQVNYVGGEEKEKLIKK